MKKIIGNKIRDIKENKLYYSIALILRITFLSGIIGMGININEKGANIFNVAFLIFNILFYLFFIGKFLPKLKYALK